MEWLWILAPLVLAVVLLLPRLQRRQSEAPTLVPALLSPPARQVFLQVQQAAGAHALVLPQVPAEALFQPAPDRALPALDLVLCDPHSLKPLLAISRSPSRALRQLCQSAGLPLEALPEQELDNPSTLPLLLAPYLGDTSAPQAQHGHLTNDERDSLFDAIQSLNRDEPVSS
ncbi:hypothetical protein [Ferrimonas balearica]|uniref:hypothetical protein n=1 Tax=Ferrimonas balearica TaxID=44012 RepID=UPI001C99D6F8|nr:hypothetical protein [Ferrimonas balearica]MBY5992871.1 hypothetical protein [Ferrimonas balearica]